MEFQITSDNNILTTNSPTKSRENDSILNSKSNHYFLINSNISNNNNSSSNHSNRFNQTIKSPPSTILIFLLSIIFFIIQLSVVNSQIIGADVNTQLNVTDFQCVQNSSINYIIIGCWKDTGHPNPSCSQNIQAAMSSKIESVDVYLEPCYTCGQPVYQATQMVNYLSTFPININVAWIDINTPTAWGNNTLENRVFFEQLTQTITNRGVQVGVFSSETTWGAIMGITYEGGSAYALWYENLDGIQSFADFKTFSGWLQPSLKRYSSSTMCDLISVYLDYTDTQGI